MQQEVRMNVTDSDPFHADEISVIHNPMKFVFDFKSMTPRLDMPGNPMRMSLKHNVITVDVHMAKIFLDALQHNIKEYEKKFGKIEEPKALEKAKKGAKKKKAKVKDPKQNYFG